MFDNAHVAAVFDQLADLMEIQGTSAFRIRAFRRIAQALEGLPEAAATMLAAGTLKNVPGIGKGAISRIEQILQTGTCDDLAALRAQLPAGLLELLQIAGVGPKTVRLVHAELGICSVDELEAAARAGHLAGLPRMGEKSQHKLLRAIEAYRQRSGRIPLGQALPHGRALAQALGAAAGVQRVELAGSSRRRRETIGDLDLLAAAVDPAPVMELFVAQPAVASVIARGDTKCSVALRSGLQVDLRVLLPASFGAALHYFTGSQMHNIAIRDRAKRSGLRVNEYGVFREPEGGAAHGPLAGERLGGETEEQVFAAVGLPFIPPELRENRGELEAAEAGQLPELITAEKLRGDLHLHTSASDGTADAREMATAAIALGREYIAVTEHSRSLAFAHGLDAARLREQTRLLRALEDELGGIRLLSGIEVDILRDGELDIDLQTLAGLDWVIASVHGGFGMESEQMTRRIIRAMESGVVDCIGHPTGRLLAERDPYAVDVDALLAAAARLGVAMELNAHPARLDLGAAHCRQARELGVKIAINTDAHDPAQLGLVEYGISTARRGWLEARDVLNAQPVTTVEALRRQRLRSSSTRR